MTAKVPAPVTVAELLTDLRIVEEVTLVPGVAEAFLDRFSSVYEPEAEKRGYRLAECLVSPPVAVDDEPVHVVMVWSLDDLPTARAGALRWDLRLIRDASPAATAFWADEAPNVVSRFRRVVRRLRTPVEPLLGAPAAGATAELPGPHLPSTQQRSVVLVHLAPGTDTAVTEQLGPALADELWDALSFSHVSVHVDVSPAGGHATWDLVVDADAVDGLAAALDRVGDRCPEVVALDAVAVEPLAGAIVDPEMKHLVKRTLLFRVRDDADPDGVEQLERALVGMVDHIPAIRNWSLARVRPLNRNPGIPQWTHLWEQEYVDAGGLLHDYLEAVYHWAHVDAFYDPDDPRGVVEMPLAHLYGWADRSVLTPAMRATGFA